MPDTSRSRVPRLASASDALAELASMTGTPSPDPLDLLHLAVVALEADHGELVLFDGRSSRWSTIPFGASIDRQAVTRVGSVGLFHDGIQTGELTFEFAPSRAAVLSPSFRSATGTAVAVAQLLALAFGSMRLTAMLEAELDEHAHDATHDTLTGLANRVAFEASIDRTLTEVSASMVTAKPVLASVAVLDINRFKEINASFGHEVGDAVVAEFAHRLVASLPSHSTAARIGGDSFAVLFSAVTSEDDALQQAQDLLQQVTGLIDIEEGALHIDAAMGVAVAPHHGSTRNVLIRRADVAMYVAKERPESAVSLWAADQERVTPGELALVADLKRALADDELTVHYQPKSTIITGDVVGLEALVRWNHPVRGWISPDELIPLAEHTGMIAGVTTFVLRTALSQCASWHRLGHQLHVAVNIPARALKDPLLPIEIAQALATVDLDGQWLTLEITETELAFDSPVCRTVMSELRKLGVRLAIDDFGTGYSALAYLARLEVDELKIDKSFVLDLSDNAANLAIVRAVVEVAESFGLSTVAEGVENQKAWDRLSILGCTTAQGYLLSRPIPADEMTRWLNDRLLNESMLTA